MGFVGAAIVTVMSLSALAGYRGWRLVLIGVLSVGVAALAFLAGHGRAWGGV